MSGMIFTVQKLHNEIAKNSCFISLMCYYGSVIIN